MGRKWGWVSGVWRLNIGKGEMWGCFEGFGWFWNGVILAGLDLQNKLIKVNNFINFI